jgi:hypothetical protein
MKMKKNLIELGWQINKSMDPSYWNKDNPKLGSHVNDDLVTVLPETLASHTAIIAQSGSGKSYFLGRLIEEILLKTKARCIILDPNADFKYLYNVVPASLWNDCTYNVPLRNGHLPTERSRQVFLRKWKEIPIVIKTSHDKEDSHLERFTLRWPSISSDFLSEEVSPEMRNGIYHCHSFTKAIGELVELKNSILTKKKYKFINEAKELLILSGFNVEKAHHLVDQKFKPKELSESKSTRYEGIITHEVLKKTLIRKNVLQYIETAMNAIPYINIDATKFYFGKAQELYASNTIDPFGSVQQKITTPKHRVEVIDLPSFSDRKLRLLAINSILTSEWQLAVSNWNNALNSPVERDHRVPTFIIIDEAHNLIPSDVNGNAEKALREQFRTIIAEGRKYGLFLIVASQRPDKLDPQVLSECENIAIMKLSSLSVLEMTKKLLGLESVDSKILNKCVEFEMGRGILLGKWVEYEHQLFYSAARRTVEGGRNLRKEYWASPYSKKS